MSGELSAVATAASTPVILTIDEVRARRYEEGIADAVGPRRVRETNAPLEVPACCPTPRPPRRFGERPANCKRRGCPYCGRLTVDNWRIVTEHNLGALGGPYVLITLTAPGADRLPWACGLEHVHSGAKGCQVDKQYADTWAEQAPENWRRIRQAARLAVQRAMGLDRPPASLVLLRVWEPQKRGVPHLHVVAGARTVLERQAAELFHQELRARAIEYGFGPQLHITKPMTGAEAARYLAGYLLGRSRRKGTIRDNLADPRMPASLIWITPAIGSISRGERMAAWRERLGLRQGTGLTMRRLRYVRWYLAALKHKVPVYPRLRGVEAIAVAKVAVLLERGPPDSWERHFEAIRLMRQLRDDELGLAA